MSCFACNCLTCEACTISINFLNSSRPASVWDFSISHSSFLCRSTMDDHWVVCSLITFFTFTSWTSALLLQTRDSSLSDGISCVITTLIAIIRQFLTKREQRPSTFRRLRTPFPSLIYLWRRNDSSALSAVLSDASSSSCRIPFAASCRVWTPFPFAESLS